MLCEQAAVKVKLTAELDETLRRRTAHCRSDDAIPVEPHSPLVPSTGSENCVAGSRSLADVLTEFEVPRPAGGSGGSARLLERWYKKALAKYHPDKAARNGLDWAAVRSPAAQQPLD